MIRQLSIKAGASLHWSRKLKLQSQHFSPVSPPCLSINRFAGTRVRNMALRQSIGVVIGSTRDNRVAPQIVDFVVDTLTAARPSKELDLEIIDLKTWNLPFYNEPGIPSKIHDTNEYKYDHTKAWSAEMKRHSAYLIVSPQYNHGYPAVLKNALDYLWYELKGKPVALVTYGGHGGSQSNKQLRQILGAMPFSLVEKSVELTFPKDLVQKAFTGRPLGLDASSDSAPWSDERETIVAAYDELLDLLIKTRDEKI